MLFVYVILTKEEMLSKMVAEILKVEKMEKGTSHTITAKIPGVLNERLENLTHTLDRKKGYLIRRAIAEYLDDNEDYLVALHRLETKGNVFSLEEIEKDCGLDV